MYIFLIFIFFLVSIERPVKETCTAVCTQLRLMSIFIILNNISFVAKVTF